MVADDNETAGALQYVTLDAIDETIKYTLGIENPSEATPKYGFKVMDVLPMLGDQGTFTSQFRSSTFTVNGVNDLKVYRGTTGSDVVTAANLVASSMYDVYYSTAGQGARGHWDQNDSVWSTANDHTKAATANAVLVVFKSDFVLATNQSLKITFTSNVVDDDGKVEEKGGFAWNSFAFQFKLSPTAANTITLEPAKVGVMVLNEDGDIPDEPVNSLSITKKTVNNAPAGPYYFRLFEQISVQGDTGMITTWVTKPGEWDFQLMDGETKTFDDLHNGTYKVLEYATAAIRDGDTTGAKRGIPDGTGKVLYNGSETTATFALSNEASESLEITNCGADPIDKRVNNLTVQKTTSNNAASGPYFFRLFVRNNNNWVPYAGTGGSDFQLSSGAIKKFVDLPDGIYMVLEYATQADRNSDTNATKAGTPNGTKTVTYNNQAFPKEFTLTGETDASLIINNEGTGTDPGPTPTPTPTPRPTPTPSPSPTPEVTPTPEPSIVPQASPLPSGSPDPDDDPDPTPTTSPTPLTPTATPTPTPGASPSPTPTPPPPPPPNPPVIPNLSTVSYNPTEAFLPLSDGSFLVLTPEGVPLGRWVLGPDYVWLFDEEIPLAFLPRTGEKIDPRWYMMLAFLNVFGIGMVLGYPMIKETLKRRFRK